MISIEKYVDWIVIFSCMVYSCIAYIYIQIDYSSTANVLTSKTFAELI